MSITHITSFRAARASRAHSNRSSSRAATGSAWPTVVNPSISIETRLTNCRSLSFNAGLRRSSTMPPSTSVLSRPDILKR